MDPERSSGRAPELDQAGRVAARLIDRDPEVVPERLLAEMVPPPRFDAVRFATYEPDPAEPTQAAAVAALKTFAARLPTDGGRVRRWFRRAPAPPEGRAGIYLDGGFGVGKPHLLSSLWHATPFPADAKVFSTFAVAVISVLANPQRTTLWIGKEARVAARCGRCRGGRWRG